MYTVISLLPVNNDMKLKDDKSSERKGTKQWKQKEYKTDNMKLRTFKLSCDKNCMQ